ncbi:MAG: deoxyhypusine synthase [Methanocellales archaeon]
MRNRYLCTPTKPISVEDRKLSELLHAMLSIGFQGRKLAETVETWVEMLSEEKITIFLGLAGAMVPAGMRRIIAFLIQKRLIDVLVSTGANIFHDCYEALGRKHYIGTSQVDDVELFKYRIDRIHDIFASEEQFRELDFMIRDFAKKLDSNKNYSSREFIYLLGEEILNRGGDEDSIIVSAYKQQIPIFIPALCDSSIGIGLMLARRNNIHINVDQMKDLDEITQISAQSEKTGVIYIGGGVPKNFIQQIEVIQDILDSRSGHEYAIQYTTDAPHWGGLSGATFEEAISWGKISKNAKKVQVFVDATIALPIVTHALRERIIGRKRQVPVFNWGEKLNLEYRLHAI